MISSAPLRRSSRPPQPHSRHSADVASARSTSQALPVRRYVSRWIRHSRGPPLARLPSPRCLRTSTTTLLFRRNTAASASARTVRALGASSRLVRLRPRSVPDASRTRVGPPEPRLRPRRQIEESRRRVLNSCRSPVRRFTSHHSHTWHVIATFAWSARRANIPARHITQKPTREDKIKSRGALSRQTHFPSQRSPRDTSKGNRSSGRVRFTRPQLSPPVRLPSATSRRACMSDPPHKQSEPRSSCPGGSSGRQCLGKTWR